MPLKVPDVHRVLDHGTTPVRRQSCFGWINASHPTRFGELNIVPRALNILGLQNVQGPSGASRPGMPAANEMPTPERFTSRCEHTVHGARSTAAITWDRTDGLLERKE
ncbi:hypothetical protein NUW54_g11306 [Trametes sanguinea]|uniref:Uncharacterized protein n=1 Tax=Trametes sanguinea TaxID=158606 RepID=A0ACC1NH60_9APHY|nr:hypothetical protein NUW54_g11306 [Trametes sanguinea]